MNMLQKYLCHWLGFLVISLPRIQISIEKYSLRSHKDGAVGKIVVTISNELSFMLAHNWLKTKSHSQKTYSDLLMLLKPFTHPHSHNISKWTDKYKVIWYIITKQNNIDEFIVCSHICCQQFFLIAVFLPNMSNPHAATL